MKITGTLNPVTEETYSYSLHDDNNRVIDKAEWIVECNGQEKLKIFDTGKFIFFLAAVGKQIKLIAKANNNSCFLILDVIAGKPDIQLQWEGVDSSGTIGIADIVKLLIQTKNIPDGEQLRVTIQEQDNKNHFYENIVFVKNGNAKFETSGGALFRVSPQMEQVFSVQVAYLDKATAETQIKVNIRKPSSPNFPTNQVFAVVGQADINTPNYAPCQYTGLEYIPDKEKPVMLWSEENDKKQNPVIEIGIIAGSKPKPFALQVDKNSSTGDCAIHDSPHAKNIFTYNEKAVLANIGNIQNTPKSIKGEAHFKYPLNILELVWLSQSKITTFQNLTITAATCRHINYIKLIVAPDIKWELALEFLVNVSNYKAANMPAGNIFAKHQEKAREAGYRRWIMNKTGKIPISIGLNLSAERNDGNTKTSFTNEFADTIELIAKAIAKAINIVQGAINYAQSAAEETELPASFDIRYPKFVILGKWYLEEKVNTQKPLNVVGEVGFGFQPLIGAEVIIDILGAAIAIAADVATANPAAAKLISEFRKGAEKLGASVVFTATFYGELNIEVDALKIDSINGIQMQGKSTIGGKMGVTIEFKMSMEIGKLNGKKYIPIDASFEAEAKADAYFGGEILINSDEYGLFLEPVLKFSGVMLSVEIKGEIGWWKSSFTIEEKVIRESTLPLGKHYFKNK